MDRLFQALHGPRWVDAVLTEYFDSLAWWVIAWAVGASVRGVETQTKYQLQIFGSYMAPFNITQFPPLPIFLMNSLCQCVPAGFSSALSWAWSFLPRVRLGRQQAAIRPPVTFRGPPLRVGSPSPVTLDNVLHSIACEYLLWSIQAAIRPPATFDGACSQGQWGICV